MKTELKQFKNCLGSVFKFVYIHLFILMSKNVENCSNKQLIVLKFYVLNAKQCNSSLKYDYIVE